MKKIFCSLIIFFITACYITYPLLFHLGDSVTSYGDELIITWIQNWVIHALFTNPLALFDTNLFYPYHTTLAYSDLHFTTSILSIVPFLLIGQPIATFNFTVLSSLVFVPFGIFCVSWYLTKNYSASLLSGLLVQFSPAFLDKKVHVQILALEWILFSVLLFMLFHKTKHTRYLLLSMLFFLFQTYNSFMPGYFLVFFYLIYLLFIFLYERTTLRFFFLKRHLFIFLATFLLLLPIVIPYYHVSTMYHAKRDIRDAIHFAIQPEDLLYPNEHTKLQEYLSSLPLNQRSQNNEFKPGYLGFVFTALILLTFVYLMKRFIGSRFLRNNRKEAKDSKEKIYLPSFINTALLGFVLSLGPVLHLGRHTIHDPFPIPLPYALFYYILPGFQGFRNSARFEMMFILFIAVVVAIVLIRLLKRYSLYTRIIIYFVLVFGIITEYNYPMQFKPIPQIAEFPKVHHWLKTIPSDKAVIIMPIYNWYMPGSAEEMMRDYYSTLHWRRMVNGASGYAPPEWEELVAILHKEFPSERTIAKLKKIGVDYIIVDKTGYDKEFSLKKRIDGKTVIDKLETSQHLRFMDKFEKYFVFEFINSRK